MPTDLQFFAPDAHPPGLADPALIDEEPALNAVFLSGVLTEPGEERDLAGGVKVVRWTLRVPRGVGRVGNDLIDCLAVDPELQLRALAWPTGSALVVEGAIRRRFFRTGGRTTTRVEVEVHLVTELPIDPGDTRSAQSEA
jgi:single-strand DNA-binding protein